MGSRFTRGLAVALVGIVAAWGGPGDDEGLRGVVRDESGRLVEGAAIRWRQGETVRVVESDALGRYADRRCTAAGGPVSLVAATDDLGPEWVAARDPSDAIDVVLRAPQPLTIEAVRPDGSPIEGVLLAWLVERVEDGLVVVPLDYRLARSEGGRATFRDVPRAVRELLMLDVDHEGDVTPSAVLGAERLEAAFERRERVVFAPARVLELVVVDAVTGTPLDATIECANAHVEEADDSSDDRRRLESPWFHEGFVAELEVEAYGHVTRRVSVALDGPGPHRVVLERPH